MNFKFLKTFLAGSVFALGSIGLTACGDDSSSASDEGDSSSSAEELVLSSVSEESPLAEGAAITANVAEDGHNGFYMTLQGILTINNEDSPVAEPEGYEGDDRVYYAIDSLSFDVGRKEGNSIIKVGNLPVPLKPGTSFGKESVNLIATVDEIPLNRDEIGCGDFVLYTTVYMSGDTVDTKQFAYTARVESPFTLQCKVIESSSSGEEVCTEMELVKDVVISNKLGSDVPAINFATGTSENPDVTMSIEDRMPSFTASAGVKIIEEGSQESGVIPEGKVCLESFTEAYNGERNPMDLENMAWYLVKTASGTYPVMIVKFMAQDDTRGDLTISYFKKK